MFSGTFCFRKLRPYIEGVPDVTVVTDHYSLVWLQNLKDPNGRLARWSVKMQQYNVKIVHRKGKEHIVPDTLSRSVPMIDLVYTQGQEDNWIEKIKKRVLEKPLKYSQWRITDDVLFRCNPRTSVFSRAMEKLENSSREEKPSKTNRKSSL